MASRRGEAIYTLSSVIRRHNLIVALPGSLASSGAEQCCLGSQLVVVAMSPGQSLGSFQVTELGVPCHILKCRIVLVSECKMQEENMHLLSNMRLITSCTY